MYISIFEIIDFIDDTDATKRGGDDGAETIPRVVFCSVTLCCKNSSLLGCDHMFIGE